MTTIHLHYPSRQAQQFRHIFDAESLDLGLAAHGEIAIRYGG